MPKDSQISVMPLPFRYHSPYMYVFSPRVSTRKSTKVFVKRPFTAPVWTGSAGRDTGGGLAGGACASIGRREASAGSAGAGRKQRAAGRSEQGGARRRHPGRRWPGRRKASLPAAACSLVRSTVRTGAARNDMHESRVARGGLIVPDACFSAAAAY